MLERTDCSGASERVRMGTGCLVAAPPGALVGGVSLPFCKGPVITGIAGCPL